MLRIARIVGPPKPAGQPNLTIGWFTDLVTDPALKTCVSDLIEAARKSAEFVTDWRNRRLAHRDLKLALRYTDIQPPPPVTRDQVEKALSGLRDVLSCIEGKYCDAGTAYSTSIALGDATQLNSTQLLFSLQGGLLRQRDRHACLDFATPAQRSIHFTNFNPTMPRLAP